MPDFHAHNSLKQTAFCFKSSFLGLAFVLLSLASLLNACTRAPTPGPVVYLEREIPNDLIGLLWLQLPESLQDGATARLLAAGPSLQDALVPSLVELPCLLKSTPAPLEFGPAEGAIRLKPDGRFEISFPWNACASCAECYMQINYTLIFSGTLPPESLESPSLYPARLKMDVAMIHSGQASPASLFQVELARQKAPLTEPYLVCAGASECQSVQFRPTP